MNILNIKLAARADTEKTQQKKENKNSEHRKYEPEEMHTAQY